MNNFKWLDPDMGGVPKGSFYVEYGVAPALRHVVMYHGPACADGFGAAFAIHKSIEKGFTAVTTLYIPMEYATRFKTLATILPHLNGVQVSVVDFSFPVESVAAMVNAGARLVEVLDHHSGAVVDLAAIDFACARGEFGDTPVITRFDNDHSGAVLAWDYYHGGELPTVFTYIEDRDLWRWTYGGTTKHTMAGIFSAPFTFAVWENYLTKQGLAKVEADGGVVTRMRSKDIAAHAGFHNLTFWELEGNTGVSVNAPWYVASDLAHKLLEMYPQIAIADVWGATGTTNRHSFRSRRGGADVAELLKPFGGGGHASAAGVELQQGSAFMAAFTAAVKQ